MESFTFESTKKTFFYVWDFVMSSAVWIVFWWSSNEADGDLIMGLSNALKILMDFVHLRAEFSTNFVDLLIFYHLLPEFSQFRSLQWNSSLEIADLYSDFLYFSFCPIISNCKNYLQEGLISWIRLIRFLKFASHITCSFLLIQQQLWARLCKTMVWTFFLTEHNFPWPLEFCS